MSAVPVARLAEYAARATATHQHVRTEAPILQWITVTVTNTGAVAGSDVVLLFMRTPTPGEEGQPLHELAGFERVFLQPGQSIDVPFAITEHDLTFTGPDGVRTTAPGTWTITVGKPVGLTLAVPVVN